jgi:hypothetical protein
MGRSGHIAMMLAHRRRGPHRNCPVSAFDYDWLNASEQKRPKAEQWTSIHSRPGAAVSEPTVAGWRDWAICTFRRRARCPEQVDLPAIAPMGDAGANRAESICDFFARKRHAQGDQSGPRGSQSALLFSGLR